MLIESLENEGSAVVRAHLGEKMTVAAHLLQSLHAVDYGSAKCHLWSGFIA